MIELNKNKMTQNIQFTKMHGAGNDYIYVDTASCPIQNPEKISVEWSRPHTGIGSDGLVLIGRSDVADFSMRIFNADGSEARMCGNASRCIGKYVYDKGLTDKTIVTLDTLSGIKTLTLHPGTDGRIATVTVDMGEPHDMQIVELGAGYGFTHGRFVSMGNPHLVLFVPDVEAVDIATIGSHLERHPLFPDGINVEFAQLLSDGRIRMRVWERGSGITQACGTGACATAVAARLDKLTDPTSTIVMDGGEVSVEWRKTDGHVYMTGGTAKVFDGEIELTTE